MSAHAPSGLDFVDELPWGAHVCQFFRSGDDLRETLVPYFKAGLENNERCLLVAMDPFSAEDARSALRAAMGDLDRREKQNQIEIHDVRSWYSSDSIINGEEIVAGLLRSEEKARSDGYTGLRTNGNIGWVHRNQWSDFQDYEARVTQGLQGRRMISMCSYCLDACSSEDVLDVVSRHSLTLGKLRGSWSAVAGTPSTRRRGFIAEGAGAPPETEHQCRAILEAIPTAIYTTDAEGYLTWFNEAASHLWGHRPGIGKQPWYGLPKLVASDGAEIAYDQSPMAMVLKTGQPVYGAEVWTERSDGTRIPCTIFSTPTSDDHGRIMGAVNMLVDISQQKAIQNRQSILVRELDHRIKNNLATVQAIAGSTIRNARSMGEFQQAFNGRIGALARTHSLLTEGNQDHISLRQLLANELEAYADGDGRRVVLAGPEVVLPAHIAVSFGMAIHELTTNALKHGALSVLAGELEVVWQWQAPDFQLQWREKNVPISGEPQRTGFGTQLLKRLLPVQLGAEVAMQFEPDGFKASISMPIT
jgi:PAS domain S-box-containing protein